VKRNLLIGATFVVALLALGVTERSLERTVTAQAKSAGQVPIFEVDPYWPKTMPKHWVFGQTIGLGIDEKDQVWIIHRGNDPGNLDGTEFAHPPAGQAPQGGGPGAAKGGYYKPGNYVSECCDPAPPVVAFNQAGDVVYGWGGPETHPDWPESNHGIIVDQKGIVWIGGNGGPDSHIMKFTREGKFVGMFGKKGARMVDGKPVANSNDMDAFGRVAKIFLDPKANEAYVADGYFNKRVAVIDMDSGKIKRYWGAYGNKPDDAPMGRYDPKAPLAQQFRTPVHCAEMSNDGMIYVCDRPNDRVQVRNPERPGDEVVLRLDQVANREPGKRCARLTRAVRRRRRNAVAERVDEDDEVLRCVYQLAGPDLLQQFAARALEPGQDQHRIRPIGIETAQRSIGQLAIEDRLAALQPEIPE